jgi:hypothetical protein
VICRHRYDGQFVDDKEHGRGVQTAADGGTFDGSFEEGKAHGDGTHTSAGGAVLEGTWHRGVAGPRQRGDSEL